MSERLKCAAYARYSTNKQKQTSIEDQLRKCREAAAMKGWDILEDHIYIDKAHTGTEMTRRDDLKRMMRIAMSPNCPFQRIVVDDTSRIARNTKEALDIFSVLTFYGVHVYYVAQAIDTTHAAAEEMITINGLIDSLHIRNLRSETFRGVEGKVLNGYSGGGKRYGYYSEPVFNGKVDIDGNPEADGYILKIDPDEANTIIRIFRLFGEEGYSARKIVNILNMELKETGSPKSPRDGYWRVSTLLGNKKALRGILNNEIYIGKYYWNRSTSMRNPETGQIHIRMKDPEKWILSLKPELRIISDDLWDKVKKRQRQSKGISNGRYMKAKASYSLNLLTGLMTCSQCGANIVVVSGGTYSKYGCSSHCNHGPAVCSNNIKIKKSEIEKTVLDTLNINFDCDGNVAYLTEKTNSILKAGFAQDRPKWKGSALQEQLRKLNKDVNNFINAIKAGIISDTVKNQLEIAENKKKEVEGQLKEAERERPVVPSLSKDIVGNYLKDIPALLSLHPVHGKTFLSRIIEKIIVHPDNEIADLSILCRKDGIFEGNYIAARLSVCNPANQTGDRDSSVLNVVTEYGGQDICMQ